MKTNPSSSSSSSPWSKFNNCFYGSSQDSDIDNGGTTNTPNTGATEVVVVTNSAVVAMRPRTLNVVRDKKNNDTKKFIRYVAHTVFQLI